jgi:hypothetical protein
MKIISKVKLIYTGCNEGDYYNVVSETECV